MLTWGPTKMASPPPARTYDSRFSRAVVETIDVEQVDRAVLAQRLRTDIAQERRVLDVRTHSRPSPLPRFENRLDVERVALSGITIDHQHRFFFREIDDAPASIVGRDGIVWQHRFHHVLARLREIDLHALGDRLSRFQPVDLHHR